MAITRAELQAQIYEILGKTPTAYGLLSPNKVNAVIQDSLDYVAASMMKIGGGWLNQVAYGTTVSGSPYVDLPPGLAIINSVKRKVGNGTYYEPIKFNDGSINSTPVYDAQGEGYIPDYSFSSGKLYLSPAPTSGLTNAIRFDGIFYPEKLWSDGSSIAGDMDNSAFITYIKWRSASILFGYGNNNVQTPPPWRETEIEWKMMANDIIARRFREPTLSRAFSDY